MTICNSNLTFVIQGAIDFSPHKEAFVTLDLIHSLRSYFPESRIILSTWEGSDISAFKAITNFEYILNEDPGPTTAKNAKPNNFNRMVKSTLSGLESVNSEFVCKLRTDMLIESSALIPIYNKLARLTYDPKLRVVTKPVLTISYSSVNPLTSSSKLLFHPCDWLFLGRLPDIYDFFDGVELNESDADYLLTHDINVSDSNYVSRFRAEQMIFINFLERKGLKIDMSSYEDYSKEKLDYSSQIITNNLIIVDGNMIGARSLKHPNISRFTPTKINYLDWKIMRLRYIKRQKTISSFLVFFIVVYCGFLNLGFKFLSKIKSIIKAI